MRVQIVVKEVFVWDDKNVEATPVRFVRLTNA